MGLLDGLFSDDPQKQAMLQMAMGLLAGAPGQRKNFGADLANAGNMGLQGYNQARVLQQRAQEGAQQRELMGYQLQNARQGIADDQAYRGAIQSAPNFAAPTAPNMAPTPENAAQLKTLSPYDQAAKMVEYLRSKGVNEKNIAPYTAQMEKLRPKFKADQQLIKMPDGSLGTVNMADDGSMQVVPYSPAEKQKEVNLGGAVGMAGEYSGKIGQSYGKTESPDAVLGAGVTMRGQNMTDSRARDLNAITREGQQTQIIETPNGPIAVNKGTAVSRPVMDGGGRAIPGDAQMKREVGARGVLGLLDEAEKQLPQSTNSYIGAGVDVLARGVGTATEGAKSIASLKTIEGALLSQMPRMEGPQSNYDVQNYKEAAGRLGDPTIPRELKKAAIDQIRAIQQRYAGGGFKYLGKE